MPVAPSVTRISKMKPDSPERVNEAWNVLKRVNEARNVLNSTEVIKKSDLYKWILDNHHHHGHDRGTYFCVEPDFPYINSKALVEYLEI